ncbi:hypothetical protein GF362_01010 [Candidatus Dojkabacteria bacterium]|nr:hypothetical protein [Candidatus Dojkabacteria bacterium]
MDIRNSLASQNDRKDEKLNIQLAEKICQKNQREAVKELIEFVFGEESKSIQSDAIKVLYEVGYRKPELIQNYVFEFIDLLSSNNNRLVWGAMTALGTIAHMKADEIWKRKEEVINAIEKGSIITRDWGIRVLANVSAEKERYRKKFFPLLIQYLKKDRPKDIAKNSVSIIVTVDENNKKEFIKVLQARLPELKKSQKKRVEKIINEIS